MIKTPANNSKLLTVPINPKIQMKCLPIILMLCPLSSLTVGKMQKLISK